jgi:hypothetical protein
MLTLFEYRINSINANNMAHNKLKRVFDPAMENSESREVPSFWDQAAGRASFATFLARQRKVENNFLIRPYVDRQKIN